MAIIYAMNDHAQDLQTFHIDNTDSLDWEDMDAFLYQNKHYLLIADSGDNFRLRFTYRMIIVQEPDLNLVKQHILLPDWSILYHYENDHSYDVESVAVDSANNKILLLSKRTDHAVLFELPIKPQSEKGLQQAKKIFEFKKIKHATAMDISQNGLLLSIHTYHRIHRYHRQTLSSTWKYQDSLSYKKLFQPEGMCLSKDEQYYFVSSERKAILAQIKNK